MGSRPYIRGSLARSVYEKMLSDQSLRSFDKTKWYCCDMDTIPTEVCALFVPNQSDEETEAFLDNCFKKSDWIFMQLYHAIAKAFLGWFMNKTSINGLLGRGSMFVFSHLQFLSLLRSSLKDDRTGVLLDLGAGDGKVTEIMASNFSEIYATEASLFMRNILQSKKYRVLDITDWWKPETGAPYYDVISCLNLLDRCDTPLTILQQIRGKLKAESGLLIVAVVLPLQQYVESSSDKHNPTEKISVFGLTFDEQVADLCLRFFPENGFQVLKWTRLPYLCEGDLHRAFYWLDDAVFLLKPITAENTCSL